MIEKIVSGGQTGADQAALDVALKLGIPHGGWIPKGRLTEEGTLDTKYQLKEMSGASYNQRTEQNVIDSDGTLIISHGSLSGGSEYTREMAVRHGRPCLHINLNSAVHFQAAQQIQSWIRANDIKVLNVAGPRASKDPDIYTATVDILETALHLEVIESVMTGPAPEDRKRAPKTVAEAVEKLLARLSLREKTMIANIPRQNLGELYSWLGEVVRSDVMIWLEHKPLIVACGRTAGRNDLSPQEAAGRIIQALWERLQQTHVLKIVRP